jgi:hypothetical protein
MLKLVESLAVKAARAKRTTVEFIPLRDSGTGWYKCAWCETTVSGKRIGWSSFKAVEQRPSSAKFDIQGDVCPRPECRISLQAKYIRPR